MNALQDWFDDDNDLPRSNDRERFDRGMFISINNHKQGNDDLYGSLKKQYQSLIYALTGSNPSRDQIKVTDKLPAQRTILQLMAKKRVVVAAALHTMMHIIKRLVEEVDITLVDITIYIFMLLVCTTRCRSIVVELMEQ